MKFFPIFVIPSTLALVAAGAPSDFLVQNQDVKTQIEDPDASAALLFDEYVDSDDEPFRMLQSSGVQPSPQATPPSTPEDEQAGNNTAENKPENFNDAFLFYARLGQFREAVGKVHKIITGVDSSLTDSPNVPIPAPKLEELSQSVSTLKKAAQALSTFQSGSEDWTELSFNMEGIETAVSSATAANIGQRFPGIKLTWETIKVGIRKVITSFADDDAVPTTREAGSVGERPTRKLLEFLE